MAGNTRGQQLLPGDPESLLQATKPTILAKNGGVAYYLALSVTVSPDGTMSVRKIKLDSGTRRAIPELLDQVEPRFASGLTPAELLRHWAQELVLDSWDTPL